MAGLPAILIAVPCMITIYLVQAFASLAVEHRHALDQLFEVAPFTTIAPAPPSALAIVAATPLRWLAGRIG